MGSEGRALVEDIRNGLHDAEIMSRHELSDSQLNKFFVRLIAAGYITKEALDAKQQEQAASANFYGNSMQTARPERSFSEPSRSVQPEPHSLAISPHLNPQPGNRQAGTLPLRVTRENASRIRRKGLIFILVSYALLTMQVMVYEITDL